MKTRLAIAMLLASTLAACGGGGDGGTTGSSSSAGLSGLWQGNAESVLITPDGELWGFQQNSTGYGLAQGTVTRTASSLAGTVQAYPLGVAASSTVTGSLTGSVLTGALSNRYLSTSFSGTSSRYHLNTPLVSRVSGAYALHTGGQLEVSASGSVTGTDQGCNFTGTVTPDSSGRNFYRFTVTFGAAPCLVPNATGDGVVVPVSDNLAYVGVVSGQVGLGYVLTR